MRDDEAVGERTTLHVDMAKQQQQPKQTQVFKDDEHHEHEEHDGGCDYDCDGFNHFHLCC